MEIELIKLVTLIEELGWDHQRMSTSGQKTYDKIILSLNRVIRLRNKEK